MPTPKQVRYHYSKIIKLHYRLTLALRDAHNAGVIAYEGYDGEAPCQTHNLTRVRIKNTCEKQLAKAMHSEIVGKKWY